MCFESCQLYSVTWPICKSSFKVGRCVYRDYSVSQLRVASCGARLCSCDGLQRECELAANRISKIRVVYSNCESYL